MVGARKHLEKGRRRPAPTPDTPAPGASRLDAAGVLELQRSAGNAAVARMLSGTARPVLQRSPSSWKTATTGIVGLQKGWSPKSRWPAVRDHAKLYGTLAATDLAGRTATLLTLEQNIGKWRANQAQNLTQNDLDRKKAAAVDQLDQLIAQERREIAGLQAPPALQPVAPAPPPLAQTQPQQLPSTQPLAQPNLSTPAPPPSPAWPIVPQETFEEEDESGVGSLAATPSSLDDLPFELEIEEKPRARRGERYEEKAKEKEEEKKPVDEDEKKPVDVDETEASGSEEGTLEEYEPLPKDTSNDPRFPFAVHLRVHMTRKDYLESIRETGLVAGKEQGIGLPDESKKKTSERLPDPAWLYALDLSNKETTKFVAMESGGEPIMMVSTTIGDKDVNYPQGGAVRYAPHAPPVRQFPQEATAPAYSFALPMTPRSKTGLTQFVNRHAPKPVSEDEVARVVEVSLRRKIPLHVLKKFPKEKATGTTQ